MENRKALGAKEPQTHTHIYTRDETRGRKTLETYHCTHDRATDPPTPGAPSSFSSSPLVAVRSFRGEEIAQEKKKRAPRISVQEKREEKRHRVQPQKDRVCQRLPRRLRYGQSEGTGVRGGLGKEG